MIIYKTTNLLNGKIYVGQDSHSDPKYLGSGVYIYNSIRKYGKKNFIKEIIDSTEVKKNLDQKEILWIKFYNCKFPNGYNLTDGGQGANGWNHSKETKRKISEANKGKLKGRHLSEETRKKLVTL